MPNNYASLWPSYVSNSANSSAMVRDALMSVAPKVSAEVFKQAYEREPVMDAWHLAQALLANSPLQPEVLKMMYIYGLPSFYTNIVEGAQNGDINVLSLLESGMAEQKGSKSVALSDLGRNVWLDTLALGTSLDSLKLMHDLVPSESSTSTKAGVYTAKGNATALQSLATAAESTSEMPEFHGVQKRLATSLLGNGWQTPDANVRQWLEILAITDTLIGAASAQSWLNALGEELGPENIILPNSNKSRSLPRKPRWEETEVSPFILNAFPNPSSDVAYLVFEAPKGASKVRLEILDAHGRTVEKVSGLQTNGIVELTTTQWPAGIYIAQLHTDGQLTGTVKMSVLH